LVLVGLKGFTMDHMVREILDLFQLLILYLLPEAVEVLGLALVQTLVDPEVVEINLTEDQKLQVIHLIPRLLIQDPKEILAVLEVTVVLIQWVEEEELLLSVVIIQGQLEALAVLV
jgi:hypothetical protein|tara:strand:+ start:312 stop:659 length:348 start_codon:yes stop_codon:yes gene_type:complete